MVTDVVDVVVGSASLPLQAAPNTATAATVAIRRFRVRMQMASLRSFGAAKLYGRVPDTALDRGLRVGLSPKVTVEAT